MKHSLLLALCATGASLVAQGGTLYSPRNMASSEGIQYSYYLGRYPAMQQQMVDGELRGKVASIKEIAFRLDNRSYYSYYGAGRSWSNVTIQMADGDLSTFSASYTANMKSTPTTVFSASVTWPDVSGFPLTSPALWGGVTGAYRFPFSTNWLSLGKSDVITDWTFTGGTLANNVAWTSTSSRYYYFDGYGSPTTNASGTYVSIPQTRLDNNSVGVTGRCNDSAFGTTTSGAYSYIYGTIYGPYYSNVEWQNKLVMYSTSYYTAFESPVIHAWGFQSSQTGVDIGTGCNKLHALAPYFLSTYVVPPKAVSSSAYSGYRYLVAPWSNAFANAKITMQAGWADSATGKLNLSQAREVTLPQSAPTGDIPLRAGIYSYAANGPYGPYDYYYVNTPMRYSY